MSIHMTQREVEAICRRTGQKSPPGCQRSETKTKYGNRRTTVDGITFDSQHEADVWSELQIQVRAGDYLAICRQVPFGLPGNVKYIADFVGLKPGGTYEVMDAKSTATAKNRVYRIKKKQMEACLGIRIKEL